MANSRDATRRGEFPQESFDGILLTTSYRDALRPGYSYRDALRPGYSYRDALRPGYCQLLVRLDPTDG